jgi:2,4-dienoyl-CoA reductase-like NADH-dependent reductase (Old Yellow Enzyme family)
MSALFQPYGLRALQLRNRIVIAPMCEYSAVAGCATDWHLIHLGHLALSGAGLLMVEATAVEPRGRITRECLGLYSDENEGALRRVLQAVRQYSGMPIGVQLAHAGRKGSRIKPSDGRAPIPPGQGGWRTLAPSATAFAQDWATPEELDPAGMRLVIAAFVQATQRCERLGVDVIELHAAHGYLLSSFLSPIANRRTDAYGGSTEQRMRFPLEVFEAVRRAWPQDRPLGVRCNGTDWDERGITPDDAVAFACELRRLGCDFVDVSSGGNSEAAIPIGPGYQVPLAARIRREARIPTVAVGLIRDPRAAEAIIAEGQADLVALARGILDNPRWPWHAARLLGGQAEMPYQYARAVQLEPCPLKEAA